MRVTAFAKQGLHHMRTKGGKISAKVSRDLKEVILNFIVTKVFTRNMNATRQTKNSKTVILVATRLV